jgi:hypothetical protein
MLDRAVTSTASPAGSYWRSSHRASLGRHGVGLPYTEQRLRNLAEFTGGTPCGARLGAESIAHATRPEMSSPSRFQGGQLAQITNALIAAHKTVG